MSSTLQKAVAQKPIYRDPRNMITLLLWSLVLASHAILIPMLVRDLYRKFVKHRM